MFPVWFFLKSHVCHIFPVVDHVTEWSLSFVKPCWFVMTNKSACECLHKCCFTFHSSRFAACLWSAHITALTGDGLSPWRWMCSNPNSLNLLLHLRAHARCSRLFGRVRDNTRWPCCTVSFARTKRPQQQRVTWTIALRPCVAVRAAAEPVPPLWKWDRGLYH